MDNPTASGRSNQGSLEELPVVFTQCGIEAKMIVVDAVVGRAASDEDARFSYGFHSHRKGCADASVVGKDQPAPRARLWFNLGIDLGIDPIGRHRWFFDTVLKLPLKFVEPVVRISRII
jgi:hypothetical protein